MDTHEVRVTPSGLWVYVRKSIVTDYGRLLRIRANYGGLWRITVVYCGLWRFMAVYGGLYGGYGRIMVAYGFRNLNVGSIFEVLLYRVERDLIIKNNVAL